MGNLYLLTKIKSKIVDKRWLVVCMVLYKLILELCYVFILSPRFEASLMTINLNWGKFLISTVLVLFTLFFFPTDHSKPSTHMYGLMYLFIFIPTVSYFWLNNQPANYILIEALCFVLIAVGLKIDSRCLQSKKSIMKKKRKIGVSLIIILFVVYLIATIILVVHNGGIDLRTLSWKNVYEVRAENNISGIWGYMLNWCAKSFMPFFFAYFWIRREYIGMFVVCVLQCFTFLSFGFKAFLMAVFLIIGVCILMAFDEKKFIRNLVGLISIGIILTSIIDVLGITRYGTLLLPYRTLMLPAQGQFEYYDFFTHHRYLYFSEGMIGRLLGVRYPYGYQIGRIVNMYIYGPFKQSNGNTGIFSYGFADAGFAGMILSAVIIMIVLIVINRSTKKLPVAVPVIAMAYQIFVLNDNSIFISLNTGGIIWTVLLLMLLNWAFPTINIKKRLAVNRHIDNKVMIPMKNCVVYIAEKFKSKIELCIKYVFPKVLSKIQLSSFRNCDIHETARIDCKCALTNVNMGRYSYVGASCSITDAVIGNFCSIAGGCQIGGGEHPLDTVSSSPVFLAGRNILGKNFAQLSFKASKTVWIGHDVWIGANSYIKGGVKIGTGAVIGAHAVVTKDVAPYEIVVGCPAKFLRKRFDDDIVEKLTELEWWNWSEEKLDELGCYFDNPKVLFEKSQDKY